MVRMLHLTRHAKATEKNEQHRGNDEGRRRHEDYREGEPQRGMSEQNGLVTPDCREDSGSVKTSQQKLCTSTGREIEEEITMHGKVLEQE